MMMKPIALFLLLTLTLAGAAPLPAQEKRPRITKEEFRTRQKAYLTQKAGLTDEEAAKFFPLYFELQDKKQQLHNRTGRLAVEARQLPEDDDEGTGRLLDRMAGLRLQAEQLEGSYLEHYRKFLSNRKIFKLLMAEREFHRELIRGTKSSGGKGRQESPCCSPEKCGE